MASTLDLTSMTPSALHSYATAQLNELSRSQALQADEIQRIQVLQDIALAVGMFGWHHVRPIDCYERISLA